MKSSLLKLVLFFAIITLISCKEKTKEYQKPKGLITTEQADKMEEAYKANQHKIINKYLSNKGTNVIDNREVWFSLEELENYIEYVKKESSKRKLENLGIRVYFGAKKDKDGIYKSTIFFFPTNNSTTKMSSTGMSITKSIIIENENSYGIDGLNYGSSGRPPSEYN